MLPIWGRVRHRLRVIVQWVFVEEAELRAAHGVRVARPRPATDAEVQEWADRHDIQIGGSSGHLRAAFEDAETHHSTRITAGVALPPEPQRFMVSSIKHQAGIVTLVTLNAEDVLPPLEVGQEVTLTPAGVKGDGNGSV